MVTIIFDFDDTLFQTHKLKKTIFDKMESFGIPIDLIKKSYEISKKKFSHYTPDNHIEIINKTKKFHITKNQREEINQIDFSFHKVEEMHHILSKLSKKNKLVLLTIGDQNFQKLKISNSGFSHLFKEVHIIDSKKEDFISKQNYKEEVFFVNDKKKENNIIKKKFPQIKVIDFNIKRGSLEKLPLDKLL